MRRPPSARPKVFLESCAGLSDAEARDLLEQILAPGTATDAVYVHEWSPGDFVVWDNRSTLHSATVTGRQ
eukprot:Skav203026  [mRNA]  locus=scaffold583:354935:355640:+ [translate_table: standard]